MNCILDLLDEANNFRAEARLFIALVGNLLGEHASSSESDPSSSLSAFNGFSSFIYSSFRFALRFEKKYRDCQPLGKCSGHVKC